MFRANFSMGILMGLLNRVMHVTHQIDHDDVKNAMMDLHEVVGVVQGEVHVKHV
jgi:hypothetical protein